MTLKDILKNKDYIEATQDIDLDFLKYDKKTNALVYGINQFTDITSEGLFMLCSGYELSFFISSKPVYGLAFDYVKSYNFNIYIQKKKINYKKKNNGK